MLIGDATARRIRRIGPDNKLRGDVPGRNLDLVPASQPAGEPAPNLALPNKTLDFAVDSSGRLIVAHPGRHAVEIYELAG